MHNDQSKHQAVHGAAPATQPNSQSARRRMLFKGLAKGGAALAVVVPIRTLAAPTVVGANKLCSVSGVMSNVGSHNIGSTSGTCKGYSPSYYATLANWPGYVAIPTPVATNSVDGISFTQNSTFVSVFGSGSVTTLITLITNSPTADETAWAVALLNAIKNPATFNFPYTATQVRAFYNSADATLKANALAFFKGYMQTIG